MRAQMPATLKIEAVRILSRTNYPGMLALGSDDCGLLYSRRSQRCWSPCEAINFRFDRLQINSINDANRCKRLRCSNSPQNAMRPSGHSSNREDRSASRSVVAIPANETGRLGIGSQPRQRDR